MAKPPSKRRRVELTLQDKINLIKESESFPKPSQKFLSEKFGVGKTSLWYFKNIKVHKLPVTWHHNKKTWMNSKIFSNWISEVDKQMRRQNRHILMFLDNASSHDKDLKLNNVILKFLHLLPLDQGIIRSF